MGRQGMLLGLLLALAGCVQDKQQQAYRLFNEGAAFSLRAIDEPNANQAAKLEKQAIEKYLQTLQVDSTHLIARSALGHSYYLLHDFPTAIRWFEASNKLDTASVTCYRELGLSRLGTGDMEGGWADLQTALRLDSANGPTALAKTKTVTVNDLMSLGQQVFGYGEGYAAQGELAKACGYQEAGVNILLLGYTIQPIRKDVARSIAERAAKLHNESLRAKYAGLAQ